jgi:hypothetical protein
MISRLILVLLILPVFLPAQEVEYYTHDRFQYANKVYDEDIHTVQMHPLGNQASPPWLMLGGGSRLILSFDDFSMKVEDLNYRIIHCDFEWNKSDLDFFRYANGIEEGYITDLDYSRAFNQRYIHYRLQIPNDEVQLKASGNYIVQVYRNQDPSQTLLTQRFYVTENRVTVNMDIHRAFDPAYRFQKQEVDFTIDHPKFQILNAGQTVKVALLQNMRWDNAITDLEPLFIENQRLVYNYDDGNSFWAGNEFRFIDIRNFNLKSQNVEGFVKRIDTMHIFLDKMKPGKQHSQFDRINNAMGFFTIGTNEGMEYYVDADYAMVYFYLLMDQPLPSSDVYIFGGMSGWEHSEPFRMQYNRKKGRYEKPLYLKQGIYNWHFHSVKRGSSVGDPKPTEGSFAETTNRYYVLVYYKGVTDEYDRLICFAFDNFPDSLFDSDGFQAE